MKYTIEAKQGKEYDVVIVTSFGTFKSVLLGTVGSMPRARKGTKIVDLGRDGKESVMLCVPVEDGDEIFIAIEDENGNMYHASSKDAPPESRTGKGKMLPTVGIIRPKWVYPFRLKGK